MNRQLKEFHMSEMIVCPKCNISIELTELLKAPLIVKARKQFERQLAQKNAELAKHELRLRTQQQALVKARQAIEVKVAHTLERERQSLARAERKKAKLALAHDLKRRDLLLAELQRNLNAKNAKLAEAQRTQADVLRKGRELDDAKREINLVIERKVQNSLTAVRAKARAEVEDTMRALVSKKETQLAGMQRQIEELRRKSEQGSQQLQGESLERELESLLRDRFPHDQIDPTLKGNFGGDLLQRVFSPKGKPCGRMLWEAKRTKAWTDKWLAKLRLDQRAAKAEVALIVSDVLPKGVETFDLIDNVWVTKLRFAIPLSIALRQSLIDLTTSRQATLGQRTKAELVYQYLTGPRFRQRIEAIVEKFTDMQTDLDQERKAMNRLWARREQQLSSVLDASAGLYGDIQGIAGRVMPEIEGLDLHAITQEGQSASPRLKRPEIDPVHRLSPPGPSSDD